MPEDAATRMSPTQPPAQPAAKAGAQPAASLTQVSAGHWRIDGDMGLAQVAELARRAPPTAYAGELRLDLAGVRRTSSAAVALLLEWQAGLRACSAGLTLVDPPESLRRLAALSNVDGLLGLADAAAPTSRAAAGSMHGRG